MAAAQRLRIAGTYSYTLGLLLPAALLGSCSAHASDWLYGIHFYGDPAASHVETMTGGKGIWSLEIVVPYSDVWWGAPWQRDNRFNHMVNQGHTIICRLEPQWGYAVPQPPQYPLADYLTRVHDAAEALKNHVHIWQIGNEMNLYGEYNNQVLTAATYIDYFKQIRAAIKSVQSPLGEQIVLLGPPSPGAVQSGVRHTDGLVYLAQMCQLVNDDDFDGFAIHAYGAPWLNAAQARQDLETGYASQACTIDSFGFSGKPVFITEFNRASTPSIASTEAESAKFLHGAFSDLHAWNQRLRAHPISAACWFIYQYDASSWGQYSIEYLHTVNPAGQDNDLFDAFTYAASLNLPSAAPTGPMPKRMFDAAPPGVNAAPGAFVQADSNSITAYRVVDGDITTKWVSALTTPLHWLQFDLGSAKTLAGFVVKHAAISGDLPSANTQAFMFETAPTSSGPWTIEESVYNDANVTQRTFIVPRGRRYSRIYIVDPGASTGARIAEVELHTITPGDFDSDGNVDLADVAAFQPCVTGANNLVQPGGTPDPAACLWAHFDEDGDIDADDAADLAAALTGP